MRPVVNEPGGPGERMGPGDPLGLRLAQVGRALWLFRGRSVLYGLVRRGFLASGSELCCVGRVRPMAPGSRARDTLG